MTSCSLPRRKTTALLCLSNISSAAQSEMASSQLVRAFKKSSKKPSTRRSTPFAIMNNAINLRYRTRFLGRRIFGSVAFVVTLVYASSIFPNPQRWRFPDSKLLAYCHPDLRKRAHNILGCSPAKSLDLRCFCLRPDGRLLQPDRLLLTNPPKMQSAFHSGDERRPR